MPNIVPVAATGLPEIPNRRGFLRSLAALPLIGGGITIVGSPVKAAVPVTDALLHSYKCWLHYEHRMLSYELAGYDIGRADLIEHSFWEGNEGAHWHFREPPGGEGPAGWISAPQPSTRAAVVLSAVGCDWRARHE